MASKIQVGNFWRNLIATRPSQNFSNSFNTRLKDVKNVEYDTVIIGCGLSGASLAFNILRKNRNHKVLVVDKRSFVCDGATGRNGGHQMRRLGSELERRDIFKIRNLISNLGIDCQFHETGAYLLGNLYLPNPDKLGEIENVEYKFAYGKSAPYYSDPGQLVPIELVLGMCKFVNSLGGEIVVNCEVKEIDRVTPNGSSRRLKLRLKDSLNSHFVSIETQNVVHASNGYGINLLPETLRNLVKPVKGQCIAFTVIDELGNIVRDAFPCSLDLQVASNSFGEYLIQRRDDGVVVLGGCRHLAKNFGIKDIKGTDSYELDEEPEEAVFLGLQQLAKDLLFKKYNQSYHIQIVGSWCGTMCFTEDHHPICGEVENSPGEFYSVGFSGHGMVRAFSCSEYISEKILNLPVTSPEIETIFSPNRFHN